jgi:hypothetical protein
VKRKDVRFIKAPEDSSLWKCRWIECMGGCGVAGSGYCTEHGEWDNPNCPKFKVVPKYLRGEF